MLRLTVSVLFCCFVFIYLFCLVLNNSISKQLREFYWLCSMKVPVPCYQLPLFIFPVYFCRCCLYHNCDLPVESVSNHCCKLSSTLHSQVLEAQIFSSKLLQAYLVKVIIFLWFFTHTSLQIAHSLCFSVYGFMLD